MRERGGEGGREGETERERERERGKEGGRFTLIRRERYRDPVFITSVV